VTSDDLATVIFSSGSTGRAEGCHAEPLQRASNVDAVCQVVQFHQDDRILGILPLFHSFGYLVLWAGVRRGLGLVFHPNPLDAEAIGDLVARFRVTFLLATPTFLQLYLADAARRASSARC
jgi:acyl-[acyl-carrier-protein]-phospholipid O-acyltransferase/long-chain-fatty-acid--[acyl-carrier-protein] ligase